jgi:hypothetical protein
MLRSAIVCGTEEAIQTVSGLLVVFAKCDRWKLGKHQQTRSGTSDYVASHDFPIEVVIHAFS